MLHGDEEKIRDKDGEEQEEQMKAKEMKNSEKGEEIFSCSFFVVAFAFFFTFSSLPSVSLLLSLFLSLSLFLPPSLFWHSVRTPMSTRIRQWKDKDNNEDNNVFAVLA